MLLEVINKKQYFRLFLVLLFLFYFNLRYSTILQTTNLKYHEFLHLKWFSDFYNIFSTDYKILGSVGVKKEFCG